MWLKFSWFCRLNSISVLCYFLVLANLLVLENCRKFFFQNGIIGKLITKQENDACFDYGSYKFLGKKKLPNSCFL